VSMKVCDETDGLWLKIFDKESTDIVSCTAQDLKEVQDRNGRSSRLNLECVQSSL
jgi:hypothetical protein